MGTNDLIDALMNGFNNNEKMGRFCNRQSLFQYFGECDCIHGDFSDNEESPTEYIYIYGERLYVGHYIDADKIIVDANKNIIFLYRLDN